jgi:rod shape-determining protein MreC
MRDTWILSGAIVMVLCLTIFYPSAGWAVRTVLFRADNSKDAYERVLQENTVLRAIHATDASLRTAGGTDLAGVGSGNASGTLSGIPVFVFSRSPFNYKDQILVSAGKDQNIKEGDAAVVSANDPGVLLGKVITVYGKTALVRTVFDANFESAVRVGDQAIDALLKGGASPHITLIPRRSEIKAGDVVYAAGAGFPYGLPIGTIKEMTIAADNVFEEATIDISYDMNRVTALRIIPGMPQ